MGAPVVPEDVADGAVHKTAPGRGPGRGRRPPVTVVPKEDEVTIEGP